MRACLCENKNVGGEGFGFRVEGVGKRLGLEEGALLPGLLPGNSLPRNPLGQRVLTQIHNEC